MGWFREFQLWGIWWGFKQFYYFSPSIVSFDSLSENVSEIPSLENERYESNDNKDIHKICNKLFEVSVIMKKHNMKLTKKIKNWWRIKKKYNWSWKWNVKKCGARDVQIEFHSTITSLKEDKRSWYAREIRS